MTTHYRAFYPAVESAIVLNADAKRFPLRESAAQAAKDCRDYWHAEGEELVVYRISDGEVRQMSSQVKRVFVVTDSE